MRPGMNRCILSDNSLIKSLNKLVPLPACTPVSVSAGAMAEQFFCIITLLLHLCKLVHKSAEIAQCQLMNELERLTFRKFFSF